MPHHTDHSPCGCSSLMKEGLLSFAQAARCLPAINGRRHAPSTVYRWCRWGIKGVKLEYVRIGRTMATTSAALNRFFAALAVADDAAVLQLPVKSDTILKS